MERGVRERIAKAENDLNLGAGPDPPLSEAHKAIAIARRIRREIRRYLTREALRRAK
jgi:hypothetical protein